jgi:hypothetical protein
MYAGITRALGAKLERCPRRTKPAGEIVPKLVTV